ncbi:MAG: hypothetical protein K2H22_06805, partial [Muribaculaceae bacterium]|nr:hypothetical protein [Muribaculaceae bacterium]
MNDTDKSILRFILRSLMIVSLGLVILVLWYVMADPFKVLRHYDDYFPDPRHADVRIGMNKGMVTLTNFEDRLKEGHRYDAFIFGSSISCYYNAEKWAAIIEEAKKDSKADHTGNENKKINPYHFDSSSESLVSMARKISYLDRKGIPIRHALIVLDPIIMGTQTSEGPAYLDPPQLHGSFLETLKYHYTFFRAAANADFFKSYIPSMIKGVSEENGRNLLFEVQPIVYDKIHSQETIHEWGSLIRTDGRSFYKEHPLRKSPSEFSESRKVLT